MSTFLFVSILVITGLDLFSMFLFCFSWMLGGHTGQPYPTGFKANYQKLYDKIMAQTGGSSSIADSTARKFVKLNYWTSLFTRAFVLFFALIVRYQWFYDAQGTEKYELSIKYEWVYPVSVFILWLIDFSPRFGKRLVTYLKEWDFCFMLLLTSILFTIWFFVK
ncbi:MAG TPA: hypothetical protein DEQ30_08500, partial [Porphyromonadaceae bacterium]|nr:hypothetical protein [Porphyromonadaceae bacterium]